jgi:xanthine dehydrogenase molybdenum-binding subunit
MSLKIVGKSVQRLDAVDKVTGRARYSEDFFERDMLVGKVLRSPYAHARVKRIDAAKARALPGVEAVLLPRDLPRVKFPTAGHPWALDPGHRDVADRLILTEKARFVGDAVAAVVAVDPLVAEQALRLIEVEYEVLPHVLTAEDALEEGAPVLHDERPDNVVSSFGTQYGDIDAALAAADRVFEGHFETSIVQHCHLEPQTAFAFVDAHGRVVVNTSTQIPHIVRRIVAQALDLRWGQVQVIKPCVGGGFGAKQDVVIEPLVAAMTLAVHGRPVRCTFSREEVFIDSRTRHSMKLDLRVAVNNDGKLQGIEVKVLSNTGAYASHGHSIAMSTGTKFRPLYWFPNFRFRPRTVYTNLPVAGAMRGYGVPQMFFALESLMEDIAREMRLDPIEFRRRNLIAEGFQDPLTGNVVRSFGIPECIAKGKELIRWDEKKRAYANQAGPLRRGLGMACFAYASGTHPVGLELAGARIVMHQDGSVTLQVGATEIGQGSDTVFAQIVAEVLGIGMDQVNVVTVQDTDIAPFDTGAYASRQTFVTGIAVRKAALEAKAQVLAIASRKCGLAAEELDIQDGTVVETAIGRSLCSLAEIAMESYYDRIYANPIRSDVSANVRINAMSYGVTFVEVEVDLETGRIQVAEIYNVHDSGRIINPQLAEGQVQGGVSMALGMALLEQMLFDPRTGKPLNNNLLDYKLPTIMDTPRIHAAFVETRDAAGSFGSKSLGECPVISPAPALRNAVLDATGVAFNKIPLYPQAVFEKFKQMGLIPEGSVEDVQHLSPARA